MCVRYVDSPPPNPNMTLFELFGREVLSWGRPRNDVDRIASAVDRLSLAGEVESAGADAPEASRAAPSATAAAGATDEVTARLNTLSLGSVPENSRAAGGVPTAGRVYTCRACGNAFSLQKTLSMHAKVCV